MNAGSVDAVVSGHLLRGGSRSPLLDLVRLTRVLRGAGECEEPVEVIATPADTPYLCGVAGAAGLRICPLSPMRAHPLGQGRPPAELASALRAVTARVVLVSLTLGGGPVDGLRAALDDAADLLVVAASGPPSPLTAHPDVLPVRSCTPSGRPSWFVDLDEDDDPRGLLAPGEDVPGPRGPATGNGVAAAVVAATAALLWSRFPTADARTVRAALRIGTTPTRRIGPPVLDAERSLEFLRQYAP
ncbi:hypothetical protein V5P93_003393 [Actinokineospora auranticolor]|uniref:hypothetical protein n=1 Tax=Actinokineospora auranticolor TaxID=155976 RepID=UPI0011B0744E|nr:hypothetical protein [Actinokineospora auranticolor]